ncbi:MAG TPA: GntR family transcriptional regulator [Candidatus Limnocylindrales bacterium]|jgi:GntR family glv operon transcriptional regulator|nr:GntR family transcriptional regulator [Candidatus Limnocylindrales bacterium]
MGRTANAVVAELAAAIGAEYRPGDQLPAEPALAAAYGVSRATIREALQSLASLGLVQRVHGVGTFVAQVSPKVESALDVDLGVTEAVRAANQRLGVQVLRTDEIAAPREVAERLGLPPAGRVLWIERAILANDVPAVAATDAIPVSIASRARRPYEGGSVYRFLEEDCGLVLVGGRASVTAVGADRRVARVLRIEEGTPVLRISQVERSNDDTAVLYSEEYYVPSLFELTIRRTRRGRTGA